MDLDEKKDLSLGKAMKNGFLKSFDFSSSSTSSEFWKWNIFWTIVYWLLVGIYCYWGCEANAIGECRCCDFDAEKYYSYRTLQEVVFNLLIALPIILIVPTFALWKRYIQGWLKTLFVFGVTIILFAFVCIIVGIAVILMMDFF